MNIQSKASSAGVYQPDFVPHSVDSAKKYFLSQGANQLPPRFPRNSTSDTPLSSRSTRMQCHGCHGSIGQGAHVGSGTGKNLCTLLHSNVCQGGIAESDAWRACPPNYLAQSHVITDNFGLDFAGQASSPGVGPFGSQPTGVIVDGTPGKSVPEGVQKQVDNLRSRNQLAQHLQNNQDNGMTIGDLRKKDGLGEIVSGIENSLKINIPALSAAKTAQIPTQGPFLPGYDPQQSLSFAPPPGVGISDVRKLHSQQFTGQFRGVQPADKLFSQPGAAHGQLPQPQLPLYPPLPPLQSFGAIMKNRPALYTTNVSVPGFLPGQQVTGHQQHNHVPAVPAPPAPVHPTVQSASSAPFAAQPSIGQHQHQPVTGGYHPPLCQQQAQMFTSASHPPGIAVMAPQQSQHQGQQLQHVAGAPYHPSMAVPAPQYVGQALPPAYMPHQPATNPPLQPSTSAPLHQPQAFQQQPLSIPSHGTNQSLSETGNGQAQGSGYYYHQPHQQPQSIHPQHQQSSYLPQQSQPGHPNLSQQATQLPVQYQYSPQMNTAQSQDCEILYTSDGRQVSVLRTPAPQTPATRLEYRCSPTSGRLYQVQVPVQQQSQRIQVPSQQVSQQQLPVPAVNQWRYDRVTGSHYQVPVQTQPEMLPDPAQPHHQHHSQYVSPGTRPFAQEVKERVAGIVSLVEGGATQKSKKCWIMQRSAQQNGQSLRKMRL